MEFNGYAMIGLLVALIFLRIPIAFALLGSVLTYMMVNGMPVVVLAQKAASSLDSFVLAAIPLFILLGTVMDRTNVAEALVRFARVIIGWVPGGLAQANVVDSMFFGGISGSALADTVATGGVMIPAMKRAGYTAGFAAALTAATSLVGPIIPPSIPFIVYASLADVSVGRMFLGGIVPGLLMGFAMMAYVFVLSIRRRYPRDPFPRPKVVLDATIAALPVLSLPALIFFGVISGWFTATESAAIAVVYALVLGLYHARGMGFAALWSMFVFAAVLTGAVMLLIAGAHGFGYILTVERVPQHLAELITGAGASTGTVFVMIALLLLGLGFILSLEAALVLVTPVLVPLAIAMGIDLIHLGVFMVVVLAIGQLTPPVAITLLAAAKIANIRPQEAFSQAMPFVFLLAAAALVVGLVPQVVLWLPDLVFDQ